MKIAIVASPFVPVPPPKYGGSERVIYYLIKGLKEAGHEPILLGTQDSTVDCEIVPIARNAIFFPTDRRRISLFTSKVRAIEKRTAKLLNQLKPGVDIIHSHKFDLKDFADFPNITTLHDPFLLDRPKYINNYSLDYYEERKHLNYVSISKNQQQAYPDLHYVGVAYNGEDPGEFPIVKKPKDYLVFVGRFDREKNPHLAIQLAISKDIPIKLAGKVDYGSKSYFSEEIRPYLKHPLVEFLGEIDPKDVRTLISSALCNLHPTGFREPFGLSIIEAAYSGTPTLAIRRGSTPELIENGRTGILVEDFVEGHHLLDAALKLDRAYIAKTIRKKFNYQRMTQDYLAAYNRVISQASKKV